MKSQLKWLATATCAAVLSAYAWADIQVDNVAALSGLGANGGGYSFVQFRLDDQRFTVTGAEALGDVVWVKSIGVVQRPSYTIALNSTLRIQQSTGTEANTGISNAQNEAVIAISQPLSSSTETLTVGTASQTLRTYTFAAPFPLKKSTLYTASFYNASGTAADQPIAMYNDSTNQTTQNKNTTIHANKDANFSPCVRIIAVERSKLADVRETATWSGLWPEAPAETDTVGLNVTAANATLTMDTPATVAGLAIGSETAVGPLILTGTGSLSSTTTTIATDTKVSDIPASLGAVTLASGKTLTVGNATTLSGLAGEATSQVVYNLTEALADNATRNAAIQTFPGIVTFKAKGANGATLAYAADSTVSLASCLAFDGGTHTFKYGRSTGQGQGLFATGRGDDLPTIDVKKDTTLDFYEKDLSGWNGTVQAKPAVIRVRNGGKLKFQDYDGTGFFRDRLVLDGGASVTMVGSNFILHGGTQDAAHAQIAMLDSNTAVEATLAGQIGITNINGGQAGQKASTIAVGNNATLKASAKFVGTADGGSLTKVGSGTLELSSTETNTSNALTISAGKVLIKNGSSWGTGAITVAASAALEVEVSSADTTKIFANTLSGAGTVKKSGAGTLSLTGSVSTPVEVAAGTLDLGTNRPTLGAVAEGAILKLTATATEVVEGAMELPTTLLAAPDKARFSVVNGSGNAQEISSVSWTEGRLTLTLRVAEPTFTVTDENNGNWAGATEWPSSGNVSIAANQLTADKTVTIPAPAEGTRALTQVTVVGNDTAKVTLVVESGVTIATLVPYGYVRVDVATVNALTNAPSVPEGATLEVIAESNATLSKAISGAGTFAKGGAGVLTLGANVATTSGSIVQSGELKFSSNGYINAPASPASNIYADATGDVLVKSWATLNLAGRGADGGLLLREVTLEANATLKNETNNIGTEQRQLQKLTLLGDAIVVADKDFGLLASGHGATTLTLNGHTLTKRGSGNFWLMNATVNGGASGGKIVVEAGSITNTGANKAVTFSTPITLESALTGTPFNLTGADVTASDNLTANGPVAFAKLITVSGKTLAGTGTVTVTDMSLGGVLNVTGNLVIDRTSATGTRSFVNAIKVASGGTLTTKGDITWNSDSNEFLGSLTVASGELAIKTPGQKLGGNITIAHGATLTHAVKTAEMDKLDFANPATIKVYGTLDMCQQRWTMRTHNKLYVYPGARVIGSGDPTYGAFDAEADQANTISFCAADANSGSGEITFASNLRARANWTLDVAEGVTVNLTGVRAQTTGNGDTGDYNDNYAIAKTGAGKLIVNSNFRLNGACEGLIEVAAEKTLTLSGTVAHTAAFSGAGKILVTNDLTKDATPASAVTLNGTLGTVTGTGESAKASCALALEVASGSTLTLNNTVPTTLSKALAGGGAVNIGTGTKAAAVTLAATDNDAALTVAEKATLTVATGAGTADANKSFTDGKTVTNNGTLKLTSGYGYFKIAGTGKTVVPGSDFLFGIGSVNGAEPFSNSLEVPASANFRIRPWYGARTIVAKGTASVNGSITKDDGNSTVTLQIASGTTLSGEGRIEVPVTFADGAQLEVSQQGVLGVSSVTGTVTLTGYTATVQPVLYTTQEDVAFKAISGYTVPWKQGYYWLVKDTAKTLSAIAPVGESATAWSALSWKSSDDLVVSPNIFMLGLDLTANISAAAAEAYVALNMPATYCSTIDLTLSGENLMVFYEGTAEAMANFKSLTVEGVAAVDIGALNHVASDSVVVSGTLYPLDTAETVTPLTKPISGTGVIGVLSNNAVTLAGALGESGTFGGRLYVGENGTLTLAQSAAQELSGSLEGPGTVLINAPITLTGRLGTEAVYSGTLVIDSAGSLCFASATPTTMTGILRSVQDSAHKLTVGNGTTASVLTVTGTMGAPVAAAEGEAVVTMSTYEGYLTVAANSELRLQPTLATTLSASVTGAGKVVIGDGTSATQVTQAATGCDISAIDIAAGATYTVSTAGKAGSANVMLPATTTVTIAEGGKLQVDTIRQMNANVTGAGEVEVIAAATYVFAADQTNRLAPGKLTLKSGLVLYAARDNKTGLSVNELTLKSATLSMELAKSVTTKPVVTVAANQVLSGEGAIEVPIAFEAGAIFDAKDSTAGSSLRLTGADITWPESGTVTVRATEPVQLMLFAAASSEHFTLESSAIAQGLYLSEAKGSFGTDVTMSVLKPLGTDVLPTEVSGNETMKTAIQDQIDAWAGKGYIITKVTDITTQSTVGEVKGSAQAVDCFTNLETTLVLAPDWEGGFSTTATAVVTYDFGVSQITVKKAKLDGDDAVQSYVLACAKVSNGKTKESAADYAKGTTVSLLLDGNEATGAVALNAATLSNKFGLTAGLGEQWFALPMENLAPGTRKFTVRATNTPQAEVTP